MTRILDVQIDPVRKQDLEAVLKGLLNDGKPHIIVTPNAEMIVAAQKDPAFRDRLNRADLHLADSVSLLLAASFLKTDPIVDRITGVETLERIVDLAAREGQRVFFLGGDPGVAEHAASAMRVRHPSLIIHANSGGVIALKGGEWHMNPQVIDDMKAFSPHILAVALGHGKQEHWMEDFLPHLPSVHIAIGVGGSLDFLSGAIRRAPIWMRQAGLEWLFRLLQEPSRIGRILNAVAVFPSLVVLDKIKGRKKL